MKARSHKTSETNLITSQVDESQYICSKCKDEGGYLHKKLKGETVQGLHGPYNLQRDTEFWVDCSCLEIKRVQRIVKASAITDKFKDRGFKNFSLEGKPNVIAEMRQIAIDYYRAFESIKDSEQNSIMFSGQPGCGKTHLLMAISNGLMREKIVPVAYFPYQDGMREIAANKFEKKDEIVNKMCQVEVLFIDDLFKPIGEKVSVHKWQGDIIAEVTNYRYLNAKPMLISTEISPLGLMELFDEAAASRMIEMASDYTKTISKDMRLNHRLRKVLGE
ncbi:DnaA ATPase domain-containing protein [Lysinibacillus sp. SGAir0095]|uniref:DnaA ATPase domain-containing protein n=1 Tax=Lysinibacillus sp. SGAir0095 TaxID=2070463 RepID=UPI00143CF19D|nr:DnaA/Hda family protein [Lysinibacillus sp. SGAir0095]